MPHPTTLPVRGPLTGSLFGAELVVPTGMHIVDTVVPPGPYVEMVIAVAAGGPFIAARCPVSTAPRGGSTIAPPTFTVTPLSIQAAQPYAPPDRITPEAARFPGPVRNQKQG